MPLSLTLVGSCGGGQWEFYTPGLPPIPALITVIKGNPLSEELGGWERKGGDQEPGFQDG